MGGGSSEVTIGYKYYMGLHMVFCHGPVDKVGPLYADEKKFHSGLSSSGQITVDRPSLFGGSKKEGGIQGRIDIMMGEDTQVQNDYLLAQLGELTPAYRGVVSLVARKCYVCAMSPYPKAWAAQITRLPGQSWYSDTANINSGSANGAHVIREAILNEAWGMGLEESMIDDDSFRAAALTLYNEGLGFSLLLTGQTKVEEFIQQVLQHINGVLYTDRSTGKFILKLFRDDYDIEDLLVLDTSNIIELSSFKRPSPSDLVNEVIIVYRERGQFTDSSLAFQNLAAIQAQGEVISQTVRYPSVDSAEGAALVGFRELKQGSIPLASLKITANREAWVLNPGDVFVLNWNPKGIEQLVMRVTNINYGGIADGKIQINALEDIFGLPSSSYVTPQSSLWTDPINDPEPVPDSLLQEVPYWDLITKLSAADFNAIVSTDCFFNYLTRIPLNLVSPGYGIWTKPDGASDYTRVATGDYTPTILLAQDLDKVQETGIATTISSTLSDSVEIGTYAYIGTEIVRIDAIDEGASTIDIGRGCLDSVPQEHVSGARVWFAENYGALITTAYVPSELLYAKATPVTGVDELDISSASEESIVFDGRQNLPYPPGQFKVNTTYWPSQITGALILSWVHRDRTSQWERPIIDHYDGSVGPETGVTYTARFYGQGDLTTTPIKTTTGIDALTITWDTEGSDSGLANYAPIDGYLFSIPLDTNFRVIGSGQTVNEAQNVTEVTLSDNYAVFTGAGFFDVEDIDMGDNFSFIFSIKGGTYPGGSTYRYLIDKSNSSGGNIFALVMESNRFRCIVGAASFFTSTIDHSVDHDYLVTVQKDVPLAGRTTVVIYMDGNLLYSASLVATVSSWAGKPWAIGATWTNSTTRGSFLTASVKRVSFWDSLLTAEDIWPDNLLNEYLRATVVSVRDGEESQQACDHTCQRVGFGFGYGQLYGGL